MIEELTRLNIKKGFKETLSVLSSVDLNDEELVKIFQKRLRDGIRTFVYIENNVIIGTASLIIETKFIHKGGKVAHVEDVVVRTEYQNNEIGKKLMEYIELIAIREKCYKIILDCSEANVSFYEKCGFVRREIEMRKNLALPMD